MPWYYELFDFVGADYFYVLNREKIRKAKKEIAAIKTALDLCPGQEVLDLCCGVGRHIVPLAKAGLKVTGLDANAGLLDVARRETQSAGLTVEYVQADMREIPFVSRFDAVLNLWNSFGYLESDAENLKVLSSAARSLKPGGKFFLDVLNRDWVVRNFQAGAEVREIGEVVEVNNYRFDSATGRDVIRTDYTVDGKERTFTHSCRLYTLQELELLFTLAGLSVIRVFGGYDLRPVSLEAKQLLIVAEKGKELTGGQL